MCVIWSLDESNFYTKFHRLSKTYLEKRKQRFEKNGDSITIFNHTNGVVDFCDS